jgi:hypothetical protein
LFKIRLKDNQSLIEIAQNRGTPITEGDNEATWIKKGGLEADEEELLPITMTFLEAKKLAKKILQDRVQEKIKFVIKNLISYIHGDFLPGQILRIDLPELSAKEANITRVESQFAGLLNDTPQWIYSIEANITDNILDILNNASSKTRQIIDSTQNNTFSRIDHWIATDNATSQDKVNLIEIINPSQLLYTAGSAEENSLISSILNLDDTVIDFNYAISEIIGTGYTKALWHFNKNSGTNIPDLSGNSHDITLSADASLWYPNSSKILHSLNNYDTPNYRTWAANDHNDFSFGNGSNDSPFSLLCSFLWNYGNGHIITKCGYQTGNIQMEWAFLLGGRKFIAELIDNSTGGYIGRTYNTAIGAEYNNTVINAIMTYDGSKTSAGIKIYFNGVRVDNANYQSGSYTAMENKSNVVGNFEINAAGNRYYMPAWSYYLAGVFSKALSQTEVTKIETLIRGCL